jgi:thiol-disulfide isomerase/thioredoxin
MKKLFVTILTLQLCIAAFSQQNLPSELKGNWLNAADSIEWLYSFQPGFAVCETQFWEYKTITRQENEYNLHLVNGKEKKLLSIKVIDSTSLQITVNGINPIRCTNQKARKPDFRNYDTLEFKEPILVDDTSTIIGFIEDYDPEIFSKTGSVEYYSVLTVTGNNSKTVFQIQPDGRFSLKFRMFNPQRVWLHIDGSTQTTCFATPGDTLMICFNKLLRDVTVDDRKWVGLDDSQINHYMGKIGLLSEEIMLLSLFDIGVDPVLKRTNMGSMAQLPYQKWRMQVHEAEIHALDSIANAMHCSAKALQIMEITTELSLLEDLNRYPFENGTMAQFSQKYLDRFPRPGSSAELNLLSSEHYAYIVSLHNFYILQVLGGVYIPMITSYMDYFAKHVSDTSDLKVIDAWKNKYGTYSWSELYDRNEKEDRQSDTLQIKSFYIYSSPFNKISQKYWTKISESFKDSISIRELDYVLDQYNSDLTGQMYCMYFLKQIQEHRILNSTYVSWAKQRITSPVLLNYLLETNKAKEEIAKEHTAYAVGTHFIDSIACDKNSDAFFTTILKKFEGKVVYIDFWADWCSPCRAEFEPAAKLKQDYAGQDVVFLYFGISCKKNLWENMIKEKQVEGNHYWLNYDQGSVLQTKFNFKGIPHFVLIDKTGKIQSGEAPKPSSKAEIREWLDVLLKE